MNRLFYAVLLIIFLGVDVQAQPRLENDFSYTLRVPSVVAMESSAAHLYVLSETEGMAVFRSRRDSLQWLYTSAGMQQRGHTLGADIRFAYLFGNSNRLTVLEPTSVMGAFSATNLPSQPRNVARVNQQLFVAMGDGGLAQLSLESPKALDSSPQAIAQQQIEGKPVRDLTGNESQLIALAGDQTLLFFNKTKDGINFTKRITADRSVEHLFIADNTLMGTSADGAIFELEADGGTGELGSINESITAIKKWNDWLLIRGISGRLWTSYRLTKPTMWKANGDAGNYLAISKEQLWVSEYDRISRVTQRTDTVQTTASTPASPQQPLQIAPIANQVTAYPNPLLVPLRLKNNYPARNVQFSVQTDAPGAIVRGQSLLWEPTARRDASYEFTVIAATPAGETSRTSFSLDVRSFNAPPRFTPLRTISIPLGQPFELPIKATDPDGNSPNLIRYMGVNMPEGASLDEETGTFSWTPGSRALGENNFRVIATDQYGAASAVDVTIRVIKTAAQSNQ